MDAKARSRILAIPGMRSVCDALVNAGNYRFARQHGDSSIINSALACRTSERCFIVGNGPSLTVDDLEKLRGEDCFGANHIYKMFDKTSWRPKYYVIQDRYSALDRDLGSIPAEYIFAGAYFLRKKGLIPSGNVWCFYDRRDMARGGKYLTFSSDISKFVSVNYTVTYSMIQIAVYLGYKKIYLLGLDHRYAVEANSKGAIVSRNEVRNHAFDDVNKETVANVEGMEKAYRSARHYIEASSGLEIKNATRGGYLEVFERVDLDAVLGTRPPRCQR